MIDNLAADLDRVTDLLRVATDAETVDELAGVWLQLDQAKAELDTIVRDVAQHVGSMLADVDYDPKDGYRLPDGQIVSHYQPALRERWQGRALLRNLAVGMIDNDTGEVIPAIPLEVLTQIVPGVASDDATSSRWLSTGLKNLDVNPDDYRSREWAEPRVKKGPKR